jgi:hypothetical protein
MKLTLFGGLGAVHAVNFSLTEGLIGECQGIKRKCGQTENKSC